MVQAQAATDSMGIIEMMPLTCLLWLLAIQISWIQIIRTTLITINITTITINITTTITEATPITILDMTVADTVAGEISVAEILAAVADVIKAFNKRKRASLKFHQECPFFGLLLF
jgi:hypothetical protein